MDGSGLEHARMKPVAIGRRTKRMIESEEYECSETFCVSPRFPLLKTSMQENSWVCGDNTHGQLGVDPLGPTLAVTKPVQGPQRWSSLTFGQSHTVGITAEGKVFTWGSNLFGQLGRGSNKVSWSNVPEEVQETSFEMDSLGVAAVGAGASHTIVAAGDALYVWGDNSHGQLGCGQSGQFNGEARMFLDKPTRLRWQDTAVSVTQIACGKYHTMVVTSQSSLYTWGDNSRGQLGHGDDRQKTLPSKVDNFWGIPVKQVAAGNSHSMALTTNGFLFTWGDNSHGQLGLPLNVDEAEEVHKRRSPQGKARARRSLNQLFLDQMIEMGFLRERAELALLETGNNGVEIAVEWLMGTAEDKIVHGLQEWADSPNKSAPSGTAAAISTPRRVVQLKDVQSVAAGAKHTVAVCSKTVYAFGANSCGQLGLGSEQDSPVPNRIRTLDGASIVQVAAGKSHTLFLSKHGQVYASGSTAHGQYTRDRRASVPTKAPALGRVSPAPDSASSTHSNSMSSYDAAISVSAVDASAAADGTKPSHYCWPVPVILPGPAEVVTEGVVNTHPVVHSIVAKGNCSAFLIRGPNEVVDAAPPSLLSQLLMLLQRAEMDVSDGLNKPRSSEALNLKKILSSISMIFGNATAISAAFGTASGACIDVEQLDIINMRILDLYKASNKECSAAMAHHPMREKLQQLEAGVRDEMKRSHTKLADDIQKNVKLLGTNERAQVLLAAMQNPCLMEHSYAKPCLPKLCAAVLSSPPACQQLLIRWWSTYPGKLLEDRVVRPLQSYTTQELQVTKKLTLAVMNAIKVLAKIEEACMVHMTLPPEAFYNSLISEKMDMQDHYVAWRQSQNAATCSPTGSGPFSFCSFPFLLDAKAKTRLLQVEAKMQMEQTVAESRLEALYSHYKKNRESSDTDMVAPSAKLRMRIDMQKQQQQHEKEKGDNSKITRSNTVMRQISRFFGRGSRAPGTSWQSSSGSVTVGAADYGVGTSGRGEPATDAERRTLAKEMSHDAAIKRAASLQLPPPSVCSVAESHPDMCIVRVRRNHLVEDAMDEIARQLKKDLFKPLRVHFIGEDGIDAGGVKKEFFQLLVTELLCPDYGLLGFYPESRTYWFNRWADVGLSDFKLLGLVVGLAIYNFVLLDFPLPIALYKKMCGLKVGITDMERFQPTVGKSLRLLLEYTGPGTVEDVFCQTFAIEDERAGVLEVIELVPGGADIPVTEENRRDFVDKYVDWVLVKSVEDQYNAFREGFMMLYKGPAITLFSPAEKERLVCGNPNLDFAALKRHAKYEGGYTTETKAVVWLWDIAENIFTLAEKRMFLKFFTGSDRSPIGGLGNLKCLIQRDGPDSHKLPTSHTCFNTLLLPEYCSHEKMLSRVQLAIMNAEGFGLE